MVRALQDQTSHVKTPKIWPPNWLPVLALVLIASVWPLVGHGARQAWLKNQNRVEDWLPESFPETQRLKAFFERFGSDEFLMISWSGCTLDDPRCSLLVGRLLQPAENGQHYFQRAFSGRDLLATLMARQSGRDERSARMRLDGVFIGENSQQSAVIALVSQAGIDDRRSAMNWAWNAAEVATQLPRSDIHMAGSTADSVAVNAASTERLAELNFLSFAICLAILFVSLRNIWLVGVLFLGAIFNQQLALAIIYYSGGHVDAIQLLVANLSFVLTISAGLHYLGYYYDASHERVQSPAWTALRRACLPSVLATATTAMGFVSLCGSEIVPIARFGFYSAIVVPLNACLIVTGVAFHVTWCSRSSWKLKWLVKERLNGDEAKWSRWLVARLHRRSFLVLIIWMLTIVGVGLGITSLQTSVGTHQLLSTNDKLIHDYAWLESRIGPLVPIELVLRFQRQDLAEPLERIKLLDELRQEFERVPRVEVTWSALNLLPPLPQTQGMRGVIQRAVLSKAITNGEHDFQEMRLFYQNEYEQCWRISGRVSGSVRPDYSTLLDDVENAVERFRKKSVDRVAVDISGGVPFVYRTQRQLLRDLLSSFTWAFIMIALTMILLFRSLRGGLVSMLPNITPAAIVFGLIGWCGLEVELGTVLTASVIMGVCVDDTLHLLTHFRMSRAKGLEPAAAVEEALANCGGAMVQTAVVCGVGMLVFVLSPFTPVARFAWLTFALLMVGLVSDLILTPAILLSPFHRCFFREPDRKSAHEFHDLKSHLGAASTEVV